MNINILPHELYQLFFQHLSSYQRSTLCTVSKQWEFLLVRLIRKDYLNDDDRLKAGDYHAFVRQSMLNVSLLPSEVNLIMRLLSEGEGSLSRNPLNCLLVDTHLHANQPAVDVLYAACRLDRTDVASFLIDNNTAQYCYYLIGLYSDEPFEWFPWSVSAEILKSCNFYRLCGFCESGTNGPIKIQHLEEILLSCHPDQLEEILIHAKMGGNKSVIDFIVAWMQHPKDWDR